MNRKINGVNGEREVPWSLRGSTVNGKTHPKARAKTYKHLHRRRVTWLAHRQRRLGHRGTQTKCPSWRTASLG